MTNILTVTINSPKNNIWEGKAFTVSSENLQGKFDILPQHANFMTIVENHPIVVRTPVEELTYTFHQSLIYTHDNYVYIYTL